jgi:DNA-binding ferritin-like protein
MEANKVLNKLFELRDVTHIAHLQSNNYNEHKILNEFYDVIVDLADEFAEQYQGNTGTIITKIRSINTMEGTKMVSYLKSAKEYFTDIREKCEMITVGLVIESVLTQLNKTLYLLSLISK